MTATQDWLDTFPALRRLDAADRRLVAQAATPVAIPAGTPLFREGDACRGYLLVLDGSVRVQKVSESGREIVLYRVESGQSCVLTTSCLLNREEYGAEGVAESEVRAVLLSTAAFDELIGRSDGFRRFVFSAYASRIAELLLLIEEVAFGRIDVRLAQLLRERAGAGGSVTATHQEVAMELGTAREVVSRQLKEFERRGWVALHRGRIDIRDREALADLVRRERI